VIGGLPAARGCSDEELVAALAEAGRLEAVCAARKVAYAAEVHRRRVAADQELGLPTCYQGRGSAAEVAAALTVGRGTAAILAHLGTDLATRLPGTRAAFAAGDIDLNRARIIAERTQILDDGAAALVETRVLPRLIGRNAGQANRILTEVITRLDPAAASQRRVVAERDRTVTVTPSDDSMATVWALLPAADAITLDARLTGMATEVCTEDPRTLPQRRADALIALTHHETALTCGCGHACYTSNAPPRPAPVIRVVADAATLLRLTDTPGHLDGYGSIDPDLARRLAADATWQRLLTRTTPTGRRTPVGIGPRQSAGHLPLPNTTDPATITAAELDARFAADRYRRYPGTQLRALIQLRDRTCRHPGCPVAAEYCDIDHTIAFDTDDPTRGGLTVPSNLACLCRYHHNLKTRGTWQLTQGEFGELTFVAPAGDTHTTIPPTPGEWDTHLDDLDTTAYLNQIIRDATPARAGPGRPSTIAVVPASPRNDPEDPPPF